MKKVLLIALIFFMTTAAWAQAPQKMSYQAIIRNASNVVVASSPVGVKISLVQGSPNGTAVFVERHAKSTNANGLVSLEIGGGTTLSGSFAAIDWGKGPYFIKTETDILGGTNYSIVGSTELLSVPYALYAANSGNTAVAGPAGPAGTTGPQGPIGLTGPQGPAGAIGPQGPVGLTGPEGPAGPTGATGPIGQTGPIGPAGATGPQGPVGLTGSPGVPGIPGAAGPSGPAGATGATGPQGPVGLTGATGAQGPIGLTGPAGPIGATGLQGPIGPTGPVGPAGAQGQIGLTGPPGPQGAQGLPGPIGPAGLTWKGAWSASGTYVKDDVVGFNGASWFCLAPVSNSPTTPDADPSKWALLASQGATGPQGPLGLTGPAGPAGTQGPAGANGAVGATGPQGPAGNDGATGPQGPQGPIGLTGPQGPQGPTGSVGPIGATGPAGPQGPQGGVGASGPAGPSGTNGKTVLHGTADPASQGVDGDFYINTSTNTLFGPKANGTWPTGVSLVGPAGTAGPQGASGASGPQGPAGPIGPQGATGAQGPAGLQGISGNPGAQGPAGADGKTVLNGTVNPSSQGVNGDFYLNTTTNTLFGPKANGTWPSGISLIGPQGPAGPQGAQGATGLTGQTGPAGATGAQGPSGLLTSGSAAGNTPYWNGSSWVVNSSNIFNNGSNVGIGTTSPAEKLEVTGNFRVSGTIRTGTVTLPNTAGTNGQVLTTDGSGTATWTTVNTASVREVANEFTATTNQTSFTLTQTPSANSRVKMFINGVRISNTAYSVSGTTLTYIPANNGNNSLSSGDRIQFDYYY